MIPAGQLSENFHRHEFACKCGCGFATADAELVAVLEFVRAHFGSPIAINSGCRCPEHNKNEGGSSRSKHLQGIACDFRVIGVDADIVATFLEKTFPDRYGIGRYHGRTHLDVRPGPARWSSY